MLAGVETDAPEASAEGLRLFLAVERCGLPLLRRLRGSSPPASAWLVEGLRERAADEMKRVLSARAQLFEIARIVEERGWSCTVLKGGVAVSDGGDEVDVADLDLLLPRAEAEALARRLETKGYRSDHADAPEGSMGVRHLAPRVAEGAIQVELHHRLGSDAAVASDAGPPLRALPALRRLAPAEHLRHLLRHGTIEHPERCGNLRDLVLVAGALAGCGADDVAAVRGSVEASPLRHTLDAVLGSATCLARGEVPPDPFRAVAAANYLIVHRRTGMRLPRRVARFTRIATVSLAAGGGAYRALWIGGPTSVFVPPSWRGPTGLDQGAPRVAWLSRTLVRAGRLALATLLGWRLSRRARTAASDAAPPGA